MTKIVPNHTLLLLLYGFPGAGKTYFARQLCERMQAAHLQGDRIRGELFETPRYDKQENDVITQLMDYMAQEFLNAGISVVYDANSMRQSQRLALRELARKAHAQPLLVWFQTDTDTAYVRNAQRDRRRADDKYAAGYDRRAFDALIAHMQNPTPAEDFVVVSGKHTFNAQYSATIRRMHDLGLLSSEGVAPVVKPGMVNLVPQSNLYRGRVDNTRRNIVIR
jgi:predicted kinase